MIDRWRLQGEVDGRNGVLGDTIGGMGANA
jgi:hypothetical protein